AEEIALGLLRERRLQKPYAPAADADAVRERELLRAAARILSDGDEARRAGARDVQLPDAMTRRLRRDHDHVVPLGHRDAPEVDVEPVCEEDGRAGLEVRQHVVVPDLLLEVIGN